jgi:hypothetical protein
MWKHPRSEHGELRHGSIETRCGSIEEASIGGSDDRTKLAIEAIIEVTNVAEQVSKRGIEASKQGIEASKKRPSIQVSKRGRVEEQHPIRAIETSSIEASKEAVGRLSEFRGEPRSIQARR